ncbi:galactose-1-epimerase [Aliivibrio fischeri]|uniref:Aldose 1-epimerase n=1 Tax=Aliivibrio fischeri TaxID=668 RepID=A0A6N3Z306_ALIFS|nr:galactose-1-epimerase [Aliivibrio fischeri]MUJ20253.1 galactose-1-epimerase [Aliivibrio fischeri]MUK30134.1 galactose-1-epimerase [Aliivibrio fischeri]MUK46301.1 galactose-1-epimerase [Aliivibrio fischeri]MUK81986.1 galactose-1-epimerase [Aliivibrio fischeri]MUK84960.1 galactose-1-epimerase [Aliivibrio fischeri]
MIEQSTLFETMTQEAASDGRLAQLFELKNQHGMRAVFMDIGATWLSCKVPVKGQLREVLLGQSTMADFLEQQSYMGVTVGRYANRIANGQFKIDGIKHQVETNQAGNTLHGGPEGFNKRRWNVVEATEGSVEFGLVSSDGDQGFPGDLDVTVKYQLTNDNEVTISYKAKTNKTTPINLTNHAYFNLLGADSEHLGIDHILSVNSQEFVPTTELGIPKGQWKRVKNTNFDFTSPKVISQDFMLDKDQEKAKGYDHSFVLDKACSKGESAASLTSPDSLVTMHVFTTKPAMQVYTGNWLAGTPNRVEGEYQDYSGIALETQFLPDALNHPEWDHPSTILQPDETYQHQTCYQFIV